MSKQAVMYGAGNIGRGFLGQLFHMSGYETTFVDVNEAVVERLNREHQYPVYVTDGDRYRVWRVTDVSAVNGRDVDAVANAIANADVMATAVGVNVLPHIAAPLAAGIRQRWKRGVTAPLNIIICENKIEADRYLAALIKEHLDAEETAYFERFVGLVEPSIGRMVPATPREIAEKEPLAVCVEPYCELPVDRDAFVGEIPPIANLAPFSPFDFHIRRKLYMHNMSHALTAYLGTLRGDTYIWEAVCDPEIRSLAKAALDEISEALSKEYNVPTEDLHAFSDELLTRYENRLLGDTVLRVGRDTKRKLAANDRFVGAIRLCQKHGIHPTHILTGLAAGLRFAPAGDDASIELSTDAKENGVPHALRTYCGIEETDALTAEVSALYHRLTSIEKGDIQ